MKAVERINTVKLPIQSISSYLSNSVEQYAIDSEPRLTMLWQTEWRNGKEYLVCKWVLI